MSADPDWLKLHRLIAEKIAQLKVCFVQEITAAQGEIPDSDSSEFTAFRLTQDAAAGKWVAAMRAACIGQLQAEAQSVWEHPDLWQFLSDVSKGEIAHSVKELLHASFRFTERDFQLMERWYYLAGFAGLGSTEPAFEIACAKIIAVDEIIEKQLGVDRELAFGTPSAPKFEMPTAQLNAASSPKARPGSPASHIPEAGTRRNKGGRPRKDDERARVRQLKSEGKSWEQVKQILNRELNQSKSADAYRALLKQKPSGPGDEAA